MSEIRNIVDKLSNSNTTKTKQVSVRLTDLEFKQIQNFCDNKSLSKSLLLGCSLDYGYNNDTSDKYVSELLKIVEQRTSKTKSNMDKFIAIRVNDAHNKYLKLLTKKLRTSQSNVIIALLLSTMI